MFDPKDVPLPMDDLHGISNSVNRLVHDQYRLLLKRACVETQYIKGLEKWTQEEKSMLKSYEQKGIVRNEFKVALYEQLDEATYRSDMHKKMLNAILVIAESCDVLVRRRLIVDDILKKYETCWGELERLVETCNTKLQKTCTQKEEIDAEHARLLDMYSKYQPDQKSEDDIAVNEAQRRYEALKYSYTKSVRLCREYMDVEKVKEYEIHTEMVKYLEEFVRKTSMFLKEYGITYSFFLRNVSQIEKTSSPNMLEVIDRAKLKLADLSYVTVLEDVINKRLELYGLRSAKLGDQLVLPNTIKDDELENAKPPPTVCNAENVLTFNLCSNPNMSTQPADIQSAFAKEILERPPICPSDIDSLPHIGGTLYNCEPRKKGKKTVRWWERRYRSDSNSNRHPELPPVVQGFGDL